MNVIRVFIDTAEVKYIFISEDVLQYLHICGVEAYLVKVGADNDFNRSVMLPEVKMI